MNVYSFTVKGQNGEGISLSKYEGKVLLIVNTATHCGFTPTYKDLQELYMKYQPLGFEILDFPCNQFGEQAPEDDAGINAFCSLRYKTIFPRFSKIEVNGPNQDPLYKFLEDSLPFEGFDRHRLSPILKHINKKQDPDYASKPTIKWNFTKFLIDKKGNPLQRFEPTANKETLEKAIVALLGEARKEPLKKEEKKEMTYEEAANSIKELSLAMLPGCPHCALAKKYLKEANISYREVNWDDPKGEDIIRALKIELVPVLLVPSNEGLTLVHGEADIASWIEEQGK